MKIASFSILVLVAISPYLFQKIDAQPLNLTAQQNLTAQNLTQSQSADEFRCNISPDQPIDPVEMGSFVRGGFLIVRHVEKEVFECASPVASVPPPFKRDITIITNTWVNLSVIIYGFSFQGSMCDRTLIGEVTSCTNSRLILANGTARDCRENPIQFPLELSAPFDDPSGTSFIVISETHEYKCEPDKIKLVTIFDFGFPVLVTNCIKDVDTATVETCSGEIIERSH